LTHNAERMRRDARSRETGETRMSIGKCSWRPAAGSKKSEAGGQMTEDRRQRTGGKFRISNCEFRIEKQVVSIHNSKVNGILLECYR
jgi:hypothetical protein